MEESNVFDLNVLCDMFINKEGIAFVIDELWCSGKYIVVQL